MSGGGDKTEKPTPKRLRDARREGRVARTPDLGGWAGLLAVTLLLPMSVRGMATLYDELVARIPALVDRPAPGPALHLLRVGVVGGAKVVAPLALTLLVVGVAAAGAQGGLRVATKRFKPDFSRLNVLKGARHLVGVEGAWAAGKSVLKLALLGVVGFLQGRALVAAVAGAGPQPLMSAVGQVSGAVMGMLRAMAAAGLVLALADYGFQRRRVGRSLRMSRHEVREEHKQSEGDPHVRSAIRSRQMAMGRNRMIADVARADVVVVNPTHVAVALAYDPGRGAPRVVAKGADSVAARIREEAGKHHVPLVEDVPLARALFRVCDLGAEIPAELYDAVARILAFIFSLRRRGTAAAGGVLHPPGRSPVPEQLLRSRRRVPNNRAARTAS